MFLTVACLFRMFSAVFWNKFIPACDLSYWSTWAFFQIIFLLLFFIAFGVFRWKLFYVLEEQTLRFTVSIFWLHRLHKIWTTPCLPRLFPVYSITLASIKQSLLLKTFHDRVFEITRNVCHAAIKKPNSFFWVWEFRSTRAE